MKWFDRKVLLLFASANIISQIAVILAEFIILRLITPQLIGIWQALLLVQSYAVISRLGILNAFNREYPFSKGKKQDQRAKRFLDTTAIFILLNGSLACILIITFGMVIKSDYLWRVAILVAGVHFLLESIVTFYESVYRSNNFFDKIAKIKLMIVPAIILSIWLPYQLDFQGLLARVLLIAALKVALLHYFNPTNFKLKFNRFNFWFLFYNGWRLWLWSYLKSIGKSLPRLTLLSMSGALALGLFAPVNWMNMAFISFSGSISAYIYPNLSRELAQKEVKIGLQAWKIARYTFYLFVPVAILGYFLIPYIVPWLLPMYQEATSAMQIALIAGLVDIFLVSTTAFASSKNWKIMYTHLGWMLVIRSICVFGGYFIFDDKLLGVVWGMLISSILLCGLTYYYVKRI